VIAQLAADGTFDAPIVTEVTPFTVFHAAETITKGTIAGTKRSRTVGP